MADWPNTLINGITALGGVGLGAWLTGRREASIRANETHKRSVYLAIVVSQALERFASAAADVANDEGRYDEQELRRPQVHTPHFETAAFDVDWQAVPADLADALLSLPLRIDEANERIAAVDEHDYDPPDFDAYFDTRRRLYAELGLEALRAARTLREQAGLPQRVDREWDVEEALVRAQVESEQRRQAQAQQPPMPLPVSALAASNDQATPATTQPAVPVKSLGTE